jgi:mRNA interferase RelE/StbE
MAAYNLKIKRSAAKELEKIQKADRSRIIDRIQSLITDPRPYGSKKLSGEEKYRIRQGNYRILYQIHENIVTVVVVKIGHRSQ